MEQGPAGGPHTNPVPFDRQQEINVKLEKQRDEIDSPNLKGVEAGRQRAADCGSKVSMIDFVSFRM